MTLSLVLHIAFKEFPTRDTEKLRAEGTWRKNYIGRDQKFCVAPYLTSCVNLIEGDNIVIDELLQDPDT